MSKYQVKGRRVSLARHLPAICRAFARMARGGALAAVYSAMRSGLRPGDGAGRGGGSRGAFRPAFAPLRLAPLPAALGPPAAIRGQRARTLGCVRACSGLPPAAAGGLRFLRRAASAPPPPGGVPPASAARAARPLSRSRAGPPPRLALRPRPCPAVGFAPSPWFGPCAGAARRASVASGPRGASPRRFLGRSAPGPGGFRGPPVGVPPVVRPRPPGLVARCGGGSGGSRWVLPCAPRPPPPLGAPGARGPLGGSTPRWSGPRFSRPSPAGPPAVAGAPVRLFWRGSQSGNCQPGIDFGAEGWYI